LAKIAEPAGELRSRKLFCLRPGFAAFGERDAGVAIDRKLRLNGDLIREPRTGNANDRALLLRT
jgi:hypothetical protein